MKHPTIVWISGATEGLGRGLALTCPFPDARIVNLSRREHPDLETVRFDLTDPATWQVVAVRPGFVDSPSVRAEAELDARTYPVAEAIRAGLAGGEALDPIDAARDIWAALPPEPDQSLLLFGAVPSASHAGSPS